MANRKRELNQKQEHAIMLAVQGLNWKEICKKLNIGETTAWQWRTRNLAFNSALTKALDNTFAETGIKANQYITTAFQVLHDVTIDMDVDVSTRVEAATRLIDMSHRNIEAIKLLKENTDNLRKQYETLKAYFEEDQDNMEDQ